MEETQRLISLISNKKVFQGEKDRIFWLVDNKGQYTVKANYMHLIGDDVHVLPGDLIWNSRVSPKVSVFTSEVLWGKVLTMNQLKKGFSACKQMPSMQRRRGKLRPPIASLPLSLGLLGCPFFLDKNGLGLPFSG